MAVTAIANQIKGGDIDVSDLPSFFATVDSRC